MTNHPHPHDLKGQALSERARKAHEQQRLVEEVNDVKELMSTACGRRNVHRLLDRAGLLGPLHLFNPNSMTTAFDLGRAEALTRLDWLVRKHCASEWAQMLSEHEATTELQARQ